MARYVFFMDFYAKAVSLTFRIYFVILTYKREIPLNRMAGSIAKLEREGILFENREVKIWIFKK